jgi:hypothetical protein
VSRQRHHQPDFFINIDGYTAPVAIKMDQEAKRLSPTVRDR